MQRELFPHTELDHHVAGIVETCPINLTTEQRVWFAETLYKLLPMLGELNCGYEIDLETMTWGVTNGHDKKLH